MIVEVPHQPSPYEYDTVFLVLKSREIDKTKATEFVEGELMDDPNQVEEGKELIKKAKKIIFSYIIHIASIIEGLSVTEATPSLYLVGIDNVEYCDAIIISPNAEPIDLTQYSIRDAIALIYGDSIMRFPENLK